MRFRLMASYRSVPYEAGIGPTDRDVVLFAALPPPEALGFDPAPGYWRKQVRVEEVQAVWESRPVGMFRGERCMVLDDLGDRLHIAYLGHDAYRAEQLGYWQVDRGVFELITPHGEVSGVVEERREYHYPYRSGPGSVTGPLPAIGRVPVTGPMPSARPGPRPAAARGVTGPDAGRDGTGDAGPGSTRPGTRQPDVAPGSAQPRAGSEVLLPPAASTPLPLEAAAMRAATAAARDRGQGELAPGMSPPLRAGAGAGTPGPAGPDPAVPPLAVPPLAVPSPAGPPSAVPPSSGSAPAPAAPAAPRRHRGDRSRASAQLTFAELASQAAIPAASYALGTEQDGAMCLMRGTGGWEVFSFTAGTRHETRLFDDEESAYFYLFGVLTAEAVRTGALAPRRPGTY